MITVIRMGGECISCNVASKMFKVLDNYEIDEKDERYKMVEETLGEIPWLTNEKKKKFKELKGSATIPIDLNKVREHDKYYELQDRFSASDEFEQLWEVELNYKWNEDEDENE